MTRYPHENAHPGHADARRSDSGAGAAGGGNGAPDITAAARRVLRLILLLTSERGYPPTFRELGIAHGVSSVGTVARHVRYLEHHGLVTRAPGAARTLTVTSAGRAAARSGA
jgi:repressor LexA